MDIKAISAAPGMAVAPAHILVDKEIPVIKSEIADAAAELARFKESVAACYSALETLMNAMDGVVEPQAIEILDFQLLLLEDTDFTGKMEDAIEGQRVNAEYAVKEVSEGYTLYLNGLMDNEYLRERAADVADLSSRLIAELTGTQLNKAEPEGEYIAVGEDIPPSKVAGLDKTKLRGIVLEKGGVTSHSVILSKSLGIPCLVEAAGILAAVREGELLLLDGVAGAVAIRPDDARVLKFQSYMEEKSKEKAKLKKYLDRATKTLDGFGMRVFANITAGDEARGVLEQGGEGVGLFRSELLYMSQSVPPSEERQVQEYAKAASGLKGRPLVIRTLDVGGDKQIPYLKIGAEDNPFLGYRAIRYCLDHPELFETQLAAILRAGCEGDVRMMFPMISCKQELMKAKAMVEGVKKSLDERGKAFARDMRIGVMIETPAAALDAAFLASEAAFFSIGTNDLSQYLFAADRSNAKLANLNSHFQPGLLRAVHSIVRAGREAGIEVDICGQAGEADSLIPVWIAMGVDILSVSAPRAAAVRGRICSLRKAECDALLPEVLNAQTAEEVESTLREFLDDRRIL